jgi:hypothetical protein
MDARKMKCKVSGTQAGSHGACSREVHPEPWTQSRARQSWYHFFCSLLLQPAQIPGPDGHLTHLEVLLPPLPQARSSAQDENRSEEEEATQASSHRTDSASPAAAHRKHSSAGAHSPPHTASAMEKLLVRHAFRQSLHSVATSSRQPWATLDFSS